MATGLGPSAIASASGLSLDKCQVAHTYLAEHGDAAIFACSATKLSSGTDRLVIISHYRLLLVRWKGTFSLGKGTAFRELRLLDLRGITCEGDAGAWGFGEGAEQTTARARSARPEFEGRSRRQRRP